MGVSVLVKRYPVSIYFILTFAISWGGFLAVVGPAGFASTNWQTDERFPLAILAMLAGPAVSGILLTGFIDGRRGLREMASRLVAWRVGARWYVVALLPAPLLTAAGLFALSIPSPIFSADNKALVLISGIAAGLTTVLEEVGWTGFAVRKLRPRYTVLATGLIVGVLWGAWHLLQQLSISGTYAGAIPNAIYLPLAILSSVAQLTAYRILMVWVYDRTGESLLVTTLMHGSLTASEIFIFTPIATGVLFLTYGWLLAAALWAIAGLVVVASGGHLLRGRLD
jgi:CAAX protease family protein